MSELIIAKFGGTSAADISKINNIAQIIKQELLIGNKVIAVISAMAGMTNDLITKCSNLSKLNNISALREYDAAISNGENISAAMLALALQNINIPAKSLQGWQVPVITDNNHTNSLVESIGEQMIRDLLDKNIVPVITGFQGLSKLQGNITTLGKGGSDTSAALIAASFKADRCDIYTDVEGIYSADPRIVEKPIKLKQIDSQLLVALCDKGAKVLHPRAAIAACKYGIKMQIRSSFSEDEGTMIYTNATTQYSDKLNNLKQENIMLEKSHITSITHNRNLFKAVINAKNISSIELTDHLLRKNLGFHDLKIGENTFIITCDMHEQNLYTYELDVMIKQNLIQSYEIIDDFSRLAIIGLGVRNNKELTADIFNILKLENIDIESVTMSNLDINIDIKEDMAEKAIRLLHKLIEKE